MSSSINLNLTGVGDEIAAAAVEAMRKQQASCESSVLIGKEIAKQIGKEVSEHVAAALETALADLQKPTFDMREQILANANFILACYDGYISHEMAKHVVFASHGEHTSAFLDVWQFSRTKHHPWGVERTGAMMTTLLQGPAATSDTDALKGLYDVSKRVSARAWELYSSSGKRFHNLEELNT